MLRALLLLSLLVIPSLPAEAQADDAFDRWLEATVWPAARADGIRRVTFETAIQGLAPDLTLPDLVGPGARPGTQDTAFQAEFRSPGTYLADGKLDALAAEAAKRRKSETAALASAERRSGVPAGILLAIWGKESAFGRAAITKDAIRTLATQAYMGARRAGFLPELVAALKVIEDEHIGRADMKSSWAGALGQPQFMPSKFLAYAVDGDGDGRRDIWTTTADVLASIGAFLKAHGWTAGLPWGTEIALPPAVACTLEGPDQGASLAAWRDRGVTRADGKPLRDADVGPVGHLLMPAGRLGPAYLVSDNFYVLKAYNESDVYALTVGLVGDRIARAGRTAGRWQPLTAFARANVQRLQRALERRGHDVGTADGLIGFRTRVAIGREQQKAGLPVTCYPDPATFAAIR